MDRDITTDEIMASALTSMDGSFELTGCADDVGFGLSNNPDPYVRIRHFCNTDSDGQVIELPEFTTFVPDNHNLGIINLDAGGRSGGGGGPVEGAYEDDVY
uniref:Uncharacterized protein n=1 Tax=Ditylenchus dipsaci TaxID=166011 RepID=A0A915EJB6_9BILA